MRTNDVSDISQRMVFLRIYEILVAANQSVVDRRDFAQIDHALPWRHFDAGYPFCYFTGEVLNDLLQQPIIWQHQHMVMEAALRQLQPDLEAWLTPAIRNIMINDFFSWQPHTFRVQELVDDVKQRVLDVVDAIHSGERLQQMATAPKLLQIFLPDQRQRHITTGGLSHSLVYRLKGSSFEPVICEARLNISAKWRMHALIHGMWLVGQAGGHVRLDAEADVGPTIMQAPLYLV